MTGTIAEPDSPKRRRPRKPTVGSLMVGVSAVAVIVYSLLPLSARDPGAFESVGLATNLGAATTVAVLVRIAWSGGSPRPAEWLALSLGLAKVDGVLQRDGAFNRLLYDLTRGSLEVGGIIFRPTLTLVAMVTLVACLAALRDHRRRLPPWAKVLLLAVASLALTWGPIRELLGVMASLLPGGAGPPTSWRFRVYYQANLALGRLPGALLWAVPAVATFRDWRRADRPRWGWTERAGAAAAILLAAGWAAATIGGYRYAWSSGDLGIQLLILGAWMAAVFGLSWVVVRRLGPAWNRWIAPGPVVLPPRSPEP